MNINRLNSSFQEDAVYENVSVLEEDSNYIKVIHSYNYYIYCYGFSFGNQEAFTLRAQFILVNYDVLIFVETWLTRKGNFCFPGFIEFTKERIHSKDGGLLILITRNVFFRQIINIKSSDISVELCGFCLNKQSQN